MPENMIFREIQRILIHTVKATVDYGNSNPLACVVGIVQRGEVEKRKQRDKQQIHSLSCAVLSSFEQYYVLYVLRVREHINGLHFQHPVIHV